MSILTWLRGQTRETPQVEFAEQSTEIVVVAAETAPVVPIRVEQCREDRPKFKREYIVRLDDRARMTITCWTGYGQDRYVGGELTQPNGRWILFDPECPADKILDPTLLPLIEERFSEIREMDRTFIKSRPSEFVDESGCRWIKADSLALIDASSNPTKDREDG